MSVDMQSPPLKTVLIIALDHSFSYSDNSRLDCWYEKLCTLLRQTCRVYGAVINSTALIFLDDDQYKFDAVVLTDPVIMSRRNLYPELTDKLVSYVQDGGTLIFAPYCRLGFGSNVQATDVDSYMERVWGLPWKLGTADTREFKLNDEANIRNGEYWLSMLLGRNIFAVQLDGAEAENKLYIDPDGAGSPAIFASYERGYLCWLGDVLLQKATVWMMIILGNLRPEEQPEDTAAGSAVTLSDAA